MAGSKIIKLRRAAATQRQRIAKLGELGQSTLHAEQTLETILKLLEALEEQQRLGGLDRELPSDMPGE